jgi:hypothetical protein
MGCPGQKVFVCLVLSVCAVVSAQAAPSSGHEHMGLRQIKVVKQADGTEVVRLAVLNDTLKAISSPSRAEESLGSWLDAASAPRLMTALAVQPGVPLNADKNLSVAVNPAVVSSWAEFMEPALAMWWKLSAQANNYSGALLRYLKEGTGVAIAPSSPGGAPWRSTGLSPTWSNALSGGGKHFFPYQQASQEWLMLPMPVPKANPWLIHLGTYRY